MSINKKLIQYIDYKHISQRQFTAKCKLSEGVLRRGKNIGSGYLKAIKTNYPDLNMNWLLFDEGNMLLQEENILSDNDIEYKKQCKNCETLEKLLEAKDETIAILKHQLGIGNGSNGNSKAS